MTSEMTYWNEHAAVFDEEPDHGLRDETVAAAWDRLLRQSLPRTPGRVADLGCGTGSLSLLMAAQGHDVTGVDFAPEMVGRARAKTKGFSARFQVGDAAQPDLPAGTFDAVVVRHVLGEIPDTEAAVDRWIELLAPAGRLVLVEGRWHTGGGVAAATLLPLVQARLASVGFRLLPDPDLWGGEITDERYLIVGRR
jgi:SAM-dependent methyltransferase